MEGEEDAEFGSFVWSEFDDVFLFEENFSFADFILWISHDHLRERAFSRTVWSHDRVNFPSFDIEREVFEDFFVAGVSEEVGDGEEGHVGF